MDKEFSENISILIVDDMPDNIRTAACMLSKQGYQIAFDENGKSALQHIRDMTFDLILLDVMMPEMDGYEVCRSLKNDPEAKDIPVIFITARSDTESIVKGFQAGGIDYITKPFYETELLARVNTHLELSRHRRHLEDLVRKRTDALKTMLETREELSSEIEKKITDNINIRILPLLKNIETTSLTSAQKNCLSLVKSGLNEILSEFPQKLSSSRFNLTHTEIRIAELIRECKSSKEISDLLRISESAVNFHRNNIRKKLGIIHEKSNLKLFLQSVE